MKTLNALDKLCDLIELVLRIIGTTALAVMAVTIVTNVFTRGIGISVPITWLDELSRYLAILVTNATLPILFRNGELVGLDALVRTLPAKGRKAILIGGMIIIMLFLVLYVRSGMVITRHLLEIHELSANLRIPIWIIHAPFPIGGAVMVVFAVEILVRDIFYKSYAKSVSVSTSPLQWRK